MKAEIFLIGEKDPRALIEKSLQLTDDRIEAVRSTLFAVKGELKSLYEKRKELLRLQKEYE